MIIFLLFSLTACGVESEQVSPVQTPLEQTGGIEAVPTEAVTEVIPVMQKPDDVLFLITFEDGKLNGFKSRGNEKVEISTEQAHTGEHSLKVTGRTAAWNGPSLNVTEHVTLLEKHNFSVWVKAGVLAGYTLSVQEGEGSAAAYTNIITLSFSSNNDWIELKGSHRFSGGYSAVYVECSNPDAEYYIDDFSFSVETGSGYVYDETLPSLKEIYKDYFLVGSAVNFPDLSEKRFDIFSRHFNSLTAANAMKPSSLNKAKDEYLFDSADEMVKTIKDAGISVYGHTLVWHEQSAKWLNPEGTTYAEAKSNLEEYISTVAGHFRDDKLAAWDVLNEAIDDGTGGAAWKDALRKSPWYKAYANGGNGWDYIEDAFRFARAADPEAVLYYNDFNLDNADKSTAVAAMVKEINDKYLAEGNTRKLIEGIGMQAHYSINTDPAQVEASINRFVSLGMEISVTELDITTDGGLYFTGDMENRQAMLYARLMKLYKKYSDNIARVTFWGLDDGTSWRAKQFPCLFNADLSAKKAFYAVADPEGYLETLK